MGIMPMQSSPLLARDERSAMAGGRLNVLWSAACERKPHERGAKQGSTCEPDEARGDGQRRLIMSNEQVDADREQDAARRGDEKVDPRELALRQNRIGTIGQPEERHRRPSDQVQVGVKMAHGEVLREAHSHPEQDIQHQTQGRECEEVDVDLTHGMKFISTERCS